MKILAWKCLNEDSCFKMPPSSIRTPSGHKHVLAGQPSLSWPRIVPIYRRYLNKASPDLSLELKAIMRTFGGWDLSSEEEDESEHWSNQFRLIFQFSALALPPPYQSSVSQNVFFWLKVLQNSIDRWMDGFVWANTVFGFQNRFLLSLPKSVERSERKIVQCQKINLFVAVADSYLPIMFFKQQISRPSVHIGTATLAASNAS